MFLIFWLKMGAAHSASRSRDDCLAAGGEV